MNLRRYQVDGQPQPAYVESLRRKNMTKGLKAAWNRMVSPGESRTPAMLDLDVGVSLAKQWVHQQPDARQMSNGTLEIGADASMNWHGRLAPGACGVRILVQTLLCWGAELDEEAASERSEWEKLARDMADVLNVLAEQAGSYQAPVAGTMPAKENSGKRLK